MSDHMGYRLLLLRALQEELVGPSPQGTEIDCAKTLRFENAEEAYGPWKQQDNGEEILQRDSPTKRYGIGVLYPWDFRIEEDRIEASDAGDTALGLFSRNEAETGNTESALTKEAIKDIESSLDRGGDVSSDLDLSATNSYRPSSIGISFLAQIPPGCRIIFRSNPGRYKHAKVQIGTYETFWWLRVPISIQREFNCDDLRTQRTAKLTEEIGTESNCGLVNLCIEVYSRPNPQNPENHQEKLITVCLVNRTPLSIAAHDEQCVFQDFVGHSQVRPGARAAKGEQ